MGPCFRDTAATRAGSFTSPCTTITSGNSAIRLLLVNAKKVYLQNLVFIRGSPRDTLEGGCVHVKGHVIASNVAFVNCTGQGVRARALCGSPAPACDCRSVWKAERLNPSSAPLLSLLLFRLAEPCT